MGAASQTQNNRGQTWERATEPKSLHTRAMVLTTTELGQIFGLTGWHILEASRPVPLCQKLGAKVASYTVTERTWVPDRQRRAYLICPECRRREPAWSEARREEFYFGSH